MDKSMQLWQRIQREGARVSAEGRLIRSCVRRYIQDHPSMERALVSVLADRIRSHACDQDVLNEILHEAFKEAPHLLTAMVEDIHAVLERDPAAELAISIFLLSKGFHSLQIHRVAHWYWLRGDTFTALTLASLCCAGLGVDIHPAAQIGHGVLFDHADGIVIGATAVVGNKVTLFHGVTLGAQYGAQGDRHPKIADGVMIGANAAIIGNIKVGQNSRIGCGAVVLADVPCNSVGVGVPAVLRRRGSGADAALRNADPHALQESSCGIVI